MGGTPRFLHLSLIAVGCAALVLAACAGGDDSGEARIQDQLAYLDADGALWLVNAADSQRKKLAEDGECPAGITWSPTGNRLICGSGDGRVVMDAEGTVVGKIEMPGLRSLHWSPSGEAILYWTYERVAEETEYDLFLADDSGGLLAELGPVDIAGVRPAQGYGGFPLWSPDGSQLTYRSADTGETRIYSLDTGTEQVLEGDYHPLGWTLDGAALLVAANYQPAPEAMAFPFYEVNLLDISSRDLVRRLPELDSRFQFWISPDGSYVLALTRFNEGMHGPGLAVLDLQTGQFTPIANSVISNPTDQIGKRQVRFSPDGGQIYWVDTGPPATIYTASNDGTGLTKLGEFPSLGAALSPDLTAVAYNVSDDDVDSMTLYLAEVGGQNVRQVDYRSFAGQGSASPFQFGWRPLSP